MGRTKALIEIDGVPMAARAADVLRVAGCQRVLGYGGDPDELASVGFPVQPDRYPGTGPLGGVLGALEFLDTKEPRPEGVFIVACDLPALRGSDLAGMVAVARRRPRLDVVVARTSSIEPTCAIWRLSAIGRLRRCFDDGERALHVAIGHLESVEVEVDAAALRNINTPEELDGYP